MIRLIIWIAIAILVLSYFGISIQNVIDSPTGQENFNFVEKLIYEGWRFIVTFLTDGIHWIRAIVA